MNPTSVVSRVYLEIVNNERKAELLRRQFFFPHGTSTTALAAAHQEARGRLTFEEELELALMFLRYFQDT